MFYFISVIFTAFGVIGSILISNNDVMTSFIGFSIILVFLMMASGFIASYVSGGKNYEDGLLNGGLVGIGVTLLTIILNANLSPTNIIILLFASFGGLVAVWFRKLMFD